MQEARCERQDSGCRIRFLTFCFLLLAFCSLLLASCSLLLASCFLCPANRFLPGVVRPTVKIGLVAPFEGRYRYIGYDVIYAVRLALREANAAGGVGGYGVELVAYDDGADPVMAAEQARKLAVDPAVVTAMGHFREETTATVLGVYAKAGVSLVAPAVLDPALTCRAAFQGCWEAEVYRLGPPAGVVAGALFYRLEGLGHHQAALVTEGGPLGTALQRDTGGLSIAAGALQVWPVVSPEDADWLEEVRASDATAVICDADPVTAGEVVVALREAGWEGDFLGGPELVAPDFVAVAGQAAEGAVFVTPWPLPADIPSSAETRFFLENLVSGEKTDFITAYRAVSNGVPPGPLALPAYEGTWVLLEALERDITVHGAPTREGMAAALATVERSGLLGWITFDGGRNWGDAPFYWYRIGAGGVPVCTRHTALIPGSNQPVTRR